MRETALGMAAHHMALMTPVSVFFCVKSNVSQLQGMEGRKESARLIDGAFDLRNFFRIVLPLHRSALATSLNDPDGTFGLERSFSGHFCFWPLESVRVMASHSLPFRQQQAGGTPIGAA